MRLRAKLALTLVPLILGPVLALGWLSWVTLRDELVRDADDTLDAAVMRLEYDLATALDNARTTPVRATRTDDAAAAAETLPATGELSLTVLLPRVLTQLGMQTPDLNARLLLALPDGRVLHDSAGPGSIARLPAGLRDPANASGGMPTRISWDGVPMLARTRALAPGLLAVALLPEGSLSGRLQRLALMVLTVTLLASVALGLFLFIWLRHLVLAPIDSLQATARQLGDGELRAPVPVRTGDEFGRLALTLHEMGARLANHRERIEYMAFHDHLTGLPNRRLIRELLADQLRETRRRERVLAVLFLDLDNFKQINDNLGHGAGDELLCMLTRRLRAVIEGFAGGPNQRGRIHLARFGGDEFLVTVGELAGSALAAELAERLLDAATEPYELAAASYVVTASIGLSLYPDDAADADGLVRCADLAMYEAKAGGRNVYRFFSPELDARSAERLGIERRLRLAVCGSGLSVHYQPILELANDRLHGFEALLRWTDAELGVVSPVRFIPVAEESGLIRDIGLLVLDQVCAQLAAWRAAGLDPVPVSINVSAGHLRREDLAGPITERLRQHGLAPTDLAVEITESILMDVNADTMQRVQALERIGVALFIDDFGTGYSSLNYLRRFRIQGLKIDRSFVTDICTNAEDRCLATAMIAMAHALKVGVVAEGIEETAQLTLLRELGCDQGQGYLFARPGDAGAATVLLHAANRGGGRLLRCAATSKAPQQRSSQPAPVLVAATAR